MRIFIDSDVVISSLLSSSGAAYFLLHQLEVMPIVSSISVVEINAVARRLNIKLDKAELLIKEYFDVFKITSNPKVIKKEYEKYVIDINDAHIVAGADKAKVKFLISYNLKHFKTNKIKDELGIVVMTPALFLQYLRSR